MAEDRSSGRGGSEAQSGEEKAGMDPGKRRRFIAIAAIVVFVIALAAFLWWLNARNYESTDDAYIDAHIVHLSPQTEGRVLRVFANDNIRVRKGQLLVEIDPTDATARYDQARAQEAQAEAQLAQAQAQIGVSHATYQQALASVTGASAQAANASRDLARYRGLQKTMPAAVAGQQIDQARATAVNTAAQRNAAQRQAAGADAQVKAAGTQVQGARAQLNAARAQLQQAQINLGYTRIVAPVDGTVAQMNVAAGNYVSPGAQMLAIVPFNVWVTANFKENQLDLMRPGQKVDIRIDAYPDVDFHGHVDSIQRGAGQAFAVLPPENATGNFVKVVQRVPVKIFIDGPKDRRYVLGPGMSVVPTVHVR
ncbi:MAG TPA: HlyD family secretion protein [Rhizomicrobium sp.]|jgi:membrane fusion protein (multidrug efflux system)